MTNMQEGSDQEEAAETPEQEQAEEQANTQGKPQASELCVPTSSLAMPDDQEQMTEPEPGDSVTLQIEGKVDRIEGEMAYVTPTMVNGQEVSSKGTKTSEQKPQTQGPEQEDADQYAELQGMAQQQTI